MTRVTTANDPAARFRSENRLLVKGDRSFWLPPFRKGDVLSKLFAKSFTKNFHDFRVVSAPAFSGSL
ncbi:hypothetical protein [Novacetimonas pomaceti]|uniref:Uncharacterized protein n=1 Tax=Novacetimonas pomaceti TaxID=2021998 RepID=A0ABX5P2F4_9PROT|nr:hypothetical protein [Novacetimonas pomaceti]PYD47369.1 hypothetical protein C3920_10285 [Novacetimonas pomaceti]